MIEPQLSYLARLCVYCIVSSLELKTNKKKRSQSSSDLHDGDTRLAKVRKMDEDDTISHSQDATALPATSNGSAVKMREPLRVCLQDLFQTLYQLTFSNEMTPKILFVHKFLTYFHQCGGKRITPVLNLIPNGLMKNLLKIINFNDCSYDFILK